MMTKRYFRNEDHGKGDSEQLCGIKVQGFTRLHLPIRLNLNEEKRRENVGQIFWPAVPEACHHVLRFSSK